jgi:hypothetical protein
MFPVRFSPRFSRISRALDVALEFATLGELRLEEPPDCWEEPATGLPEASTAAADLAPILPPPFPPATAAGRRALEAKRAAKRASLSSECAGGRERGQSRRPDRHPGRQRAGAVKAPEQPCLWRGPS